MASASERSGIEVSSTSPRNAKVRWRFSGRTHFQADPPDSASIARRTRPSDSATSAGIGTATKHRIGVDIEREASDWQADERVERHRDVTTEVDRASRNLSLAALDCNRGVGEW